MLYPSKELSSNGEVSYPALSKSLFVNVSIFTMIVPPFLIQFLLAFNAAGFMATKTSAISPGVLISILPI